MKSEHQLLYKVMQHFEGMQKIDVFDILHKIEVLLFYASSPINKGNIRQIIDSSIEGGRDIDPLQFTILPNGNFCEFVGSNNWLHIYKEQKRGIGRWIALETYYFKTKYAPLELTKLTKKNLLENLRDTAEIVDVLAFLKRNQVTKKDETTGRLLLLEVSEVVGVR